MARSENDVALGNTYPVGVGGSRARNAGGRALEEDTLERERERERERESECSRSRPPAYARDGGKDF